MDSYSAMGTSDKMFDDKAPLNVDDLNSQLADEDMVKYVLAMLIEYDKAVAAGQQPNVDPLNQQLVIQLDDGSSVVVPENVQRYAIMEYMKLKNKSEPESQLAVLSPKKLIPKTKKGKIITVIAIIFLIVLVYLLYNYVNGNNVLGNNDFVVFNDYNYSF
jgi:hypothetical protein